MAGHSKFKNIQFRKGAQDKKRARVFSKLAKEITVAAKLSGPDVDANPRLRSAIQAARVQNMPKDNIERAVKKSQDAGGENYEDVRYEGFGTSGVGVIVESLTDNRNRTASEIRMIFSKGGGNLGETGTVVFMFDHVGEIIFEPDVANGDDMFEAALEAGAEDCQSDDGAHELICAAESLHDVAKAMEVKFGEPRSARLIWRPKNAVDLDEQAGEKLLKLIEALEESDDVQEVYANFEISDEVLERLSRLSA